MWVSRLIWWLSIIVARHVWRDSLSISSPGPSSVYYPASRYLASIVSQSTQSWTLIISNSSNTSSNKILIRRFIDSHVNASSKPLSTAVIQSVSGDPEIWFISLVREALSKSLLHPPLELRPLQQTPLIPPFLRLQPAYLTSNKYLWVSPQ